MRLPMVLLVVAVAIGVGAIATVFIVPEFQNWVFLFLIVAFALGITGIVLRSQPPK